MHREMSSCTVTPTLSSPQSHVHKADTLPQVQRCEHTEQAGPPGYYHTHKQNTHTLAHAHTHTSACAYLHLKEAIFFALILTTCACKLDFQSVLILCWHLLRQNRGGQTQPFGWADASLPRCRVRNCWCRINAHFYEFILCHRVEKNLGVNIHHTA